MRTLPELAAAVLAAGSVCLAGCAPGYAADSCHAFTDEWTSVQQQRAIGAALGPSNATPEILTAVLDACKSDQTVAARDTILEVGSRVAAESAAAEGPTAAESPTPTPVDAASQRYRQISDLDEYYSLPIEARLAVNWELYRLVEDRAYYNYMLRVQVDPNREFSGYWDWNPAKAGNEPTAYDSGEKILHAYLFERALSGAQTIDPDPSNSPSSRKIDLATNLQTTAGMVYDPRSELGQSMLGRVQNNYDVFDGIAYIDGDAVNFKVLETLEAEDGGPIDSDGNLPAKWVTAIYTGEYTGGEETPSIVIKFIYVTFETEGYGEQSLWVAAARTPA